MQYLLMMKKMIINRSRILMLWTETEGERFIMLRPSFVGHECCAFGVGGWVEKVFSE